MLKNLKIVSFLLILGFVFSCSSRGDEAGDFVPPVSGQFHEISPVNGRGRVDFIDGNKVVLYPKSSGFGTQFVFQINSNTNTIILDDDLSIPNKHFEYYFKIINSNKFEMTNFINQEEAIMTFEK